MGKSQEEQELEALQSLQTLKEPNPNLGTVNKEEMLNPKTKDPRLAFLNYIEVDRDIMIYKGIFYPPSWVFKTRSANGEEIVALSTINSEHPLSVDEGINDLLFTCLRIEDKKTGSIISVDQLYEFDRLWFVLFIRDLTIQNRENDLSWKVGCQHCDEKELEIKMSFDNLVEIPFSDIAEKYFNPTTRFFEVQTKSFGVIKFQPNNLKRAGIYKKYITDCAENNINPDRKFMSLFPVLINSENENDKNIIDVVYAKYRTVIADLKLLSLYKSLQEKLIVGIEQSIKCTCPKCRKEGVYEIQFPLGLHNIFFLSDINSELL